MNNNRRLHDIRIEKQKFKELLDSASTISECLTFKGKIEILEKEEKEIHEKMKE